MRVTRDSTLLDRTKARLARVDFAVSEHTDRTDLGPAPVESDARLQAGTACVASRPSPLGGSELAIRSPHQPETSGCS